MLRNAIRDKYFHLEIIEGIGLTVSRATLEGLQTILEVVHGDVTAEEADTFVVVIAMPPGAASHRHKKELWQHMFLPSGPAVPINIPALSKPTPLQSRQTMLRGHIAPHGPANPAQLSPAADFSGAARPGRLTEARLVGKAASEALQGSLHTEVELILGGRWR